MKNLILILLFCAPVLANGQDINKKDANGKKLGKWIETYEKSTTKRYEGQFKDDIPYGTFRFWYPSGKIQTVMNYSSNGKIARTKFYSEKGSLMAEGKYLNKEKDSIWVYYDDRMISYKESYKNGKLDGERVVYFVNSNVHTAVQIKPEQVYIREHYKNNEKHGTYEEFYLDGSKKIVGQYVDGNKDGTFSYFYDTGKFEKVEHYKFAVKHGVFLFFDEKGKELGKLYFDRGTLLEEQKDIDAFIAREKSGKTK